MITITTTQQQYIEAFQQFALKAVRGNKPSHSPVTTPGRFSGFESYIVGFSDKYKQLATQLKQKADTTLGEA